MGLSPEDVLWVGTRGEIEEMLVPRAGLQLDTIEGGAIVGVTWPVRLGNAIKLTASLLPVNRLLNRFSPDVILFTGGYVNGPVSLVASLRRIPSAIYLPDIEPGLAIRTLSRFVTQVACTAQASLGFFPPGKAMVTGYPLRQELRAAVNMSREEALEKFDLRPGRPTLFVFGGSRGARSINRTLMAILPQLLDEIQIIHLSGSLDWPEVEKYANTLSPEKRTFYRPYPYLHDRMGAAFRSADLVVSRAGASMLGECPSFGLPAVLVPYPHAWRYQKVNADYLVDRGAAIRLDDEKLAESLLPTVTGLLGDQTRLAEMATSAKKLDMPHAEDNLARLLLKLAKGA